MDWQPKNWRQNFSLDVIDLSLTAKKREDT